MAANDLLPDDELKSAGSPDNQGATPLTPGETAQLDQIESGLRDSSAAPSPTHTPNTPPTQKQSAGGAAAAVLRSSANPAGLAMRITGFSKKHKKGLLAGGGVMGVTSLLIAGFLALIPLKAAHFLHIITEKRFGTTESAINARAEKRVANYLEATFAKVDFATGTANGNASLIVSGSLAKDLYRNWQVAKFQDKLTQNYGLTFQKEPNSYRYTILHNGNPIARDDGTGTLTGIGNNEFRSYIDDSVKQETHWWSITQRRHIRFAMYERWHISKWFLFPKTREKIKETTLATKKRFQKAMIERVVAPISAKYAEYFSCIIDDGCDLNKTPSQLDPAKQKDKAKSSAETDLKNGNAQAHVDNSIQSNIDNAIQSSFPDETKSIGDSVFLGKIQQVLQNEIVTGVLKWAGAGLGLLELFSKLNHALEPGGAVDKIIADRNTEQFGNFFSVSASSVGQLVSGDLSSVESGQLLSRLDGAEQSRVYRKNYAGGTGTDNTTYCGGKDVTQNGKTTHVGGSKLPNGQLVCPDKKVNNEGGILSVIRDTPPYQLLHSIAGIYDATVGGVVGWFNDLTKAVFSAIGLDDLANFVTDQIFNAVKGITGFDTKAAIASGLNDVMGTFFGATLTGAEKGADFFNAMDAGGDVVGQQFAKSAGGVPLTTQQQQAYLNEANNQTVAESNGWHGYWYKIASIDNAQSLYSRLITWAPQTPGDGIRKTAAAFADWLNPATWPNKLAFAGSIALPGSHQVLADSVTPDPYGVQQWGFDLNTVRSAPLTDPTSPECQQEIATINASAVSSDYTPTKASLCMLDKIAIQSLNSWYTTQDDGGLQAQIAEDGGSAGGGPNSGGVLSGAGNARILEAALKYDNYQYAQGSNVGHGDVVGWINRCDTNPTSASCKLDCSGLVNVAVYKAFGVVEDLSSESVMQSKNWKRIPTFPQYSSDLKPGDVVRHFGHIAIVQSYDIHTNTLTIFEAATAHTTAANQIRSRYFTPAGGFTDALRYVGPGASQ